MLSPGDLFNSGSCLDLRGRVLQRLRSAKINDQVFELVQSAFENALAVDNLLLSRVERRRLLVEVLKSVLEEMNKNIDRG